MYLKRKDWEIWKWKEECGGVFHEGEHFGMLNDYRDEGENCGNLLEENTFLEERSKIRKGRNEREEKSNIKY